MRLFISGLLLLILGSAAHADGYNATVPGSGTVFGSKTVSGTENPSAVVCDPTAGTGQCASVDSAGRLTTNSQVLPTTAGGLSVFFLQPVASDNHATIKAGAGQVYKITVTNNSATINYIRLYNATTGFAGCGSSSNLVYQAAIPGSTAGTGLSDSWDLGIAFATGISICVTSGYAQSDTTNATASAMSVNIGYK